MPTASRVRWGALVVLPALLGCAAEVTWVSRPAGALPVASPALAEVPLRGALPGFGAELLPARHDLSLYFPPPGAMGGANAGVAWAGAYGLLTYLHTRGADVLPQRGGLRYHARWYDPASLKLERRGAVSPLAALQALVSTGAAPWEGRGERARLTAVERADVRDVVGLKRHLREGTPLVVTIPQDAALLRLKGAAIWRGADPEAPDDGWQSFVLCGYDDERGAFFALAAWGPDWGDRGYAWLGYEAVAREANSALVGVARPERRLEGLWRHHGQTVIKGRGEWIHDAYDVALDLVEGGEGWTGSLEVVRTWLRADRHDVVRAQVTERRSYAVSGGAGSRVLRLAATPERVETRILRRDLAGPVIHAVRREPRGLAVAGPLVRGAAVDWRTARDEDVKAALAPAVQELPDEANALRPRPWAPPTLALIARPTVYADGLVVVLDDPDAQDHLFVLRRAPLYGTPQGLRVVEVDDQRDGFWDDAGRAHALRRLRTRAPGAVTQPARLPTLAPLDEGLPLLEPAELVESEGRLWLLDSGVRRSAARATAAVQGLPVDDAAAMTPAELGTYPLGPRLE